MLSKYEVWFVTGSQGLYGEETLDQVAADSKKIADYYDSLEAIPVRVVYKPVLTTANAILAMADEANANEACIGIVSWMHTFSPAKMWIAGLEALRKPLLHFHTQYNREIPWDAIDMDFMNLNQAAHGGREYGFIVSRLRKQRKVVAGHWKDETILPGITSWIRAAAAWADAQAGKVARFGDNMRDVAVTEGDKVEAQIKFGYSVHGYGVGDLVDHYDSIEESEVGKLVEEYESTLRVDPKLKVRGEKRQSLLDEARIELSMRSFLEAGNFTAFTTTFENLHGIPQLPGFAVQRLMASGYGFGGEGDWKTAALVRAMKVMSEGLDGGTSFMEDYTYHLAPGRNIVLGAHMLEVCPSIADKKSSSLEIHPLSIGGKPDPVRLIFTAEPGPAINATVVDLGNRFRMIINEIDVIEPEADLPKLPVARAFWIPRPDLKTSATAWILSGGAHHFGYSRALDSQHLEDFAEIAGIEYIHINGNTEIRSLKQELRTNEVYYHLSKVL